LSTEQKLVEVYNVVWMKEDFCKNPTKEKEKRASRLMAQLGEGTTNAVEEGGEQGQPSSSPENDYN
jgi:hypothetical protein